MNGNTRLKETLNSGCTEMDGRIGMHPRRGMTLILQLCHGSGLLCTSGHLLYEILNGPHLVPLTLILTRCSSILGSGSRSSCRQTAMECCE